MGRQKTEEEVKVRASDPLADSIMLEKESNVPSVCSPVKIDTSSMFSGEKGKHENNLNKSLYISDDPLMAISSQSQSNKTQVFNPSKAAKKKSKKACQTTNKKDKKVKFFIKFKLGKKQYEIDFKYDLEQDNPQLIAQEMRENLHLPHEKVDVIKNQIEKLVESRKKNLIEG